MRILSSGNIARKITILVLLATTIAVGTMSVAFLAFDSISSRSLLYHRISTLADIVGQNSTAALSFSDRAAAMEILGALKADPTVVSACLYDLSGILFARYQQPASSRPCPDVPGKLALPDQGYSTVIRQVTYRNEPVGTLLLRSELREIEKRWWQVLKVIGVLLTALVIGGASGSLLQRRISRPVANLARAMHKVTGEQNFSARVAVNGHDEIAQLGTDFNRMLEELEQRDLAKKKAEAQLQYQALNDELTGLPNRRLLAERLSYSLAVAKREAHTVGLLYIDLDGFKLVNDSLGHSVGDILLGQVASRLRSRVRDSDTLARLGGDEFTVVLSHLRAEQDAALVAKQLLDVLAESFLIGDRKITISASIGISLFPKDATDPIQLLQRADSAMYAAKRNGRNGFLYYTPELGSEVRERLNLEAQLRGAIDRGEISVHYQPEFDIASNRLIRFEALARWTHPTLGMIPPVKFIPIAEESGIIVTLGAYIMENACAEAAKWQQMGPYPVQVAVNVSSVQFARQNFVEEVTGILERTGLDPHLLQIELTESVMLKAYISAAETMKRLNALGITLAIDDFGTGYSCLSYLPRLPFSALKIDPSFINELSVRPESRAMVNSLIALAHNLGMRVIVEGVERPEQLDLIRELGGNEAQGYLLGRPTPNPRAEFLPQANSAQYEPVSPPLVPECSAD